MKTKYYFKKGTLNEIVSNPKHDNSKHNFSILPKNFSISLSQNESEGLIRLPLVWGIYQIDNKDHVGGYSGINPYLIHIGYEPSIWENSDLVRASLYPLIKSFQSSAFDDTNFELSRIKISPYNKLPNFYKKDVLALYNLDHSLPKSNNVLENNKTEVTVWAENNADDLKKLSDHLNLFGMTSCEAISFNMLKKFIETKGFYPICHPLDPMRL